MSVAEKFGLHVSLHLRNLGTLVRGTIPVGVERQFAELSTVLHEYDTVCAAIEKDRNLSPEGKQAKQRDAYDKALALTQQWADMRVTGTSTQLEQQRAALAASDPTPKPTDLQVQRMADTLQGLDPHEIAVLYSDATDAEKRLMEEAVAFAGRQPRKHTDAGGNRLLWEDLLPEDRIASSVARRAAQANPEAAIAADNTQHILGAYRQAGSAAVGLLRETLPTYANR
jgi:hypothetical protein